MKGPENPKWTGGLYCGIKLKCDYNTQQLDISMPGYVKDALHKFQHPTPQQTTAPTPPVDGSKLWIYGAPTGAPRRRLPGTQS